MNARQTTIVYYGGKCAWCASTDHLEIDHVDGHGNEHRRSLKGQKLASWLVQQYRETRFWPTGYQLLCRTCHDVKSGRNKPMAETKRRRALSVSLTDAMDQQVRIAASGQSISEFMQTVLQAHFEGALATTGSAELHQHLSSLENHLTKLMQDTIELERLSSERIAAVERRLAALEKRWADEREELVQAFDRVRQPPRTLLGKLFGETG